VVEKIMTLTEYARHKGVELRAVKRAIEEGRLPKEVIKFGSNQRKLIIVSSADKFWEENTIINNKNELRQKSFSLGGDEAGRKGPEPADPTEKVGAKINTYRTVTEGYKAQLYRIEYLEKVKKLCKAEDVRRAAHEIGSNIKSALENLPDKLAPIMVAQNDLGKTHKILSDEINSALSSLSRGDFEFLKGDKE
jgi:hypothetical protein